MDEKSANLIMQGVVLLLQTSFQLMATMGKTDEEIEQLFRETRAAFDARKPEDLPDV